MYWVQLVEKNVDLGDYRADIERISIPCKNIENINKTISECLNDEYYVEDLKTQKYDLRIVYVEIED